MTKKKSAKKRPPGDSSPGANINKEERRQIIRSTCKQVEALEKKRDAISTEISQIKNEKIKGKLGMKIADFNAAYRMFKLEDDDRAVFLDTIHETFQALGIGESLDWLEASKRADEILAEQAREAADKAKDDSVQESPVKVH